MVEVELTGSLWVLLAAFLASGFLGGAAASFALIPTQSLSSRSFWIALLVVQAVSVPIWASRIEGNIEQEMSEKIFLRCSPPSKDAEPPPGVVEM